MKLALPIIIGATLLIGTVFAANYTFSDVKTYSWRYKMTVTIATPDGDVSGSSVREISNSLLPIGLPESGNPADLRGEALVIDLGKRGALISLIDDTARTEFYASLPPPNGAGNTPESMQYYAALPIGTKSELATDRYFRLVTFTDANDPTSVVLVYDRETCARAKAKPECETYADKIGTYTVVDRLEELFGQGVGLKGVTVEITEEPVTWGVIDRYLPKTFQKEIEDNWKRLPRELRHSLYHLTRFKEGDPK